MVLAAATEVQAALVLAAATEVSTDATAELLHSAAQVADELEESAWK